MILCERCRREIPNPDPATFDTRRHAIICRDGTEVRIPGLRWRLVAILMSARGHCVSRFSIIEDIWLTASDERNYRDCVRELVSRVRRNLADTSWSIETVSPDGYRLVKVDET